MKLLLISIFLVFSLIEKCYSFDRRICVLDVLEEAEILLSNFNSSLCTILNVDGAEVNDSGQLQFGNETHFKSIIPNLKKLKKENSYLKILISFKISDKNLALFGNKKTKILGKNLIEFIQKYNLKGFNIQLANVDQLNENLIKILNEISDETKDLPISSKPVISAEIQRDIIKLDTKKFNLTELDNLLSYIILKSYDYHNDYSIITTYNSPLFDGEMKTKTKSIIHLVDFLLDNNVLNSNLVISIPVHIIHYIVLNPFRKKVNGYYLKKNILSRNDFHQRNLSSSIHFKEQFDGDTAQAYIAKNFNFYTYENKESIFWKILFINENNLGGILIHNLNYDYIKSKFDPTYIRNFDIIKTVNEEIIKLEKEFEERKVTEAKSNRVKTRPKSKQS